jgi:hypothetical protein
LQDYQRVRELSPGDAEASSEIKKIEDFLKRRVKETLDGMVVSEIPVAIPGGYRVEIEEVEDFAADGAKEEKVNHL